MTNKHQNQAIGGLKNRNVKNPWWFNNLWPICGLVINRSKCMNLITVLNKNNGQEWTCISYSQNYVQTLYLSFSLTKIILTSRKFNYKWLVSLKLMISKKGVHQRVNKEKLRISMLNQNQLEEIIVAPTRW